MRLSDIKSFYINLDSRPDRRVEVENTLFNNGIEATRIAGIQGTQHPFMKPGEYGCMMSHKEALGHALLSREPIVAVYEDDVQFVPGAPDLFESWYEEVPSDWGMILLGANKLQTEVVQVSEHVQKVVNAYSAHAVIMKRNTVKRLYGALPGTAPLDVIYAWHQREVPTYTFSPSLAGQAAGFSDIMEEHVDYNWIYGL